MYLLDTKITKIAVLINIMQSVHLRAWRGLWKLYYFLLCNILLLLLSGFNVSNAQRKLLLWFKVELFLLLARCERVMPWSDNKYVSWNSDVFYSLFCHDLKLLRPKYYRISRHKINFTKEMESIIVKNSTCPINHKSWYGLYTKSK